MFAALHWHYNMLYSNHTLCCCAVWYWCDSSSILTDNQSAHSNTPGISTAASCNKSPITLRPQSMPACIAPASTHGLSSQRLFPHSTCKGALAVLCKQSQPAGAAQPKRLHCFCQLGWAVSGAQRLRHERHVCSSSSSSSSSSRGHQQEVSCAASVILCNVACQQT